MKRIKILNQCRGVQNGLKVAEAFETFKEIESGISVTGQKK